MSVTRTTALMILFLAFVGGPSNLAVGAPRVACKAVRPGLVIGFTGQPGGYALELHGRRIPLFLYSEFRGGERVRVLAPDGRLTLQASDGGATVLNQASGAVCVSREAHASIVTNFLRNIGEQFSRRRNDSAGSLVSRGDEDALALAPADLASGTAKVGAASRRLALSWTGGRAPFTLQVKRGDEVIVNEANLTGRLLRTRAARALVPGHYVVSVSDVTGQMASAGFIVIPDTMATEPLTSNEAALARAAALLAKGEDRMFDAMMVLSPYRDTDNTAKTLMDVLRWDVAPGP